MCPLRGKFVFLLHISSLSPPTSLYNYRILWYDSVKPVTFHDWLCIFLKHVKAKNTLFGRNYPFFFLLIALQCIIRFTRSPSDPLERTEQSESLLTWN